MKRLKNITLVTLILISVLLFSRVWFGTNFIEEIGKNISFAKAHPFPDSADFTTEGVITPKNIIVTGGGKRNVISKGREDYDELYDRMTTAVEKLDIKAERFFETDTDDWTSSLKSRSVLFEFAAAYSSDLIAKLGINLPDGSYKDIVFAPSDSIAVNSAVYIKNSGNGKIYKFTSDTANDGLKNIINRYAVSTDAINSPFAFELGFDKAKTNTEISQNVLLDSNIVIGLTEKSINSAVLTSGNGNFTSKTVDRLLETFKFNRTATRRYIDRDDVTVFVDSAATLKISPSYMIDYTSENGGYTLPASDGNDTTAYLNAIYGIAREVTRAAEINMMPVLVASNTDFANTKSDIIISFDYYLDGMPVYANGENGTEHGITAVLNNGVLKSYRQYLFNAEITDETENINSMISALDTLYEKFKDEKEVRLSDMFTAYATDGESAYLNPVWCAKTDDKIVTIKSK